MQYYNNIISNKLIIILCCLHSLLLLKCNTFTCLRVCPNHSRNTFTKFSEYVYTDMINFFGCVHLYVHHLLYELSIKVFPGKNLDIWNSRQKSCMTNTCFINYCVTCDTILLLLTTTMSVIKHCVTVLVHCSYKANRADSSTTWYGTPHPKFMTEQGVLFQT